VDDETLDFYLDRLTELELELSAFKKQKMESFHNAQASTIRERDNLSDYDVFPLTEEIERTKVEIRIREDEREHIRFTLSMRVPRVVQ
jgi:predicted nucleic acid-binding protein